MRILAQKEYKPGDLPPDGYLAWHEWADVQREAGIKQVTCGRCGKWKTPQEFSALVDAATLRDKKWRAVSVKTTVCAKCASLSPNVQIDGDT